MLGNIVVRFMSLVLNIAGILLLIIGLIGGWYIADSMYGNVILGALVGFFVSFILVVIFLGIAFLALEINNNLIRLNDKVATINEALKKKGEA